MSAPLYYLAGPMRGVPSFNFPAFDAAAEDMRSRGLRVVSPAELDRAHGFNPDTDPEDTLAVYMARDLPHVCEADGVVVLPGWEGSEGAGVEVGLARVLGKPVLRYPDLEPVCGESRVWRVDEPYRMTCADCGHMPDTPMHELGCAAGRAPQNPSGTGTGVVRAFTTGATRDTDERKPDPEGFLSPLVVREFCRYMHEHRKQADGSLRSSDNWQKGVPREAYVKSLWRHFLDVWTLHRGHEVEDYDGEPVDMREALAAILFNASGLLHEVILGRDAGDA